DAPSHRPSLVNGTGAALKPLHRRVTLARSLSSTVPALLLSLLMIGGHFMASAQVFGTAAEKEIDKRQMLEIYRAIRAHERDHGKLPDYLADLVPGYLKDPSVLISPVEIRTGRSALLNFGDPKIKSSYIYEFSALEARGIGTYTGERVMTMREMKTLQKEEY